MRLFSHAITLLYALTNSSAFMPSMAFTAPEDENPATFMLKSPRGFFFLISKADD